MREIQTQEKTPEKPIKEPKNKLKEPKNEQKFRIPLNPNVLKPRNGRLLNHPALQSNKKIVF